MDGSLVDSLGLPVLTPLLVGVVAFTVWILQVLKRFVYKHLKLKRHIPDAIWWILSVAIPVGLVVGANLDWVQALINHFLPINASVNLEGYGSTATGLITAIAGNGSFQTMKKLGLTKDYAPVVSPPVMEAVAPDLPAAAIPEVAPIPEVETPAACETTAQVRSDQTNAVVSHARLLSDWTGYVPDYVLIEEGGVQRLLSLKASDE